MMKRREFLRLAGTGAVAATLPWSTAFAEDAPPKRRNIRKAVMYETLGLKGSLVDQFKALKEAGFDGVEPMSHMDRDKVIDALKVSGLSAASVCCSTHWGKPLSDPDPAVWEAGLAGLKLALQDAHFYGASSVLLVPGVVNDRVNFDQCWTRSIAQIRKALPTAEKFRVKIAIEDVWNNFITTPDQAVAYVDEIASEWVGWHFDIGNMIKYSPPENWIRALGKRILKLHVKEYSKSKGFGVQFFEGDNNWPAIMKALDDVGYQGWGITEQPGEQTKDMESLKAFSARLDKVLAS
jgi:L-ribulose-5-phosphate 3-epimerase